MLQMWSYKNRNKIMKKLLLILTIAFVTSQVKSQSYGLLAGFKTDTTGVSDYTASVFGQLDSVAFFKLRLGVDMHPLGASLGIVLPLKQFNIVSGINIQDSDKLGFETGLEYKLDKTTFLNFNFKMFELDNKLSKTFMFRIGKLF
jgi:hypothetical protein